MLSGHPGDFSLPCSSAFRGLCLSPGSVPSGRGGGERRDVSKAPDLGTPGVADVPGRGGALHVGRVAPPGPRAEEPLPRGLPGFRSDVISRLERALWMGRGPARNSF
ncbi:uncharacterized protein LOC100617493 isoform X9 [Monodelphis domestica]|uniref:uncharacterized protein LOC100617493 isoform X9 n=1 Tax=Monodelphis domestica TaxID=13616 RepID=UPI0024E1A1A8|nr:uncharacterized protein LOC100617493 isoform X9 [Monodelphis domestica]